MSQLRRLMPLMFLVSTTSSLCHAQDYSVFPGDANKAYADGNYSRAIELYTEAIEEMEAHEQSIEKNLQLRLCYLHRAQARVQLKPSVEADRDLIKLAMMGEKFLMGMQTSLVEAAVTRQLTRNLQDAALWCLRADVRRRSNEYLRAIQDYSQALVLSQTDDERVMIYNARSLVWRQAKQDAAALKDLAEAIRLKPEDTSAYSARALLHREAGRLEQAIEDFSVVIEKTKEDKDYPFHYHDLLWRAELYLKVGDFLSARGDLNSLLARKLNDVQRVTVLSLRAQVLRELNLVPESEQDEKEVARLDPEKYVKELVKAIDIIKRRKRLDVLLAGPLDGEVAGNLWNLGNALSIGAFTNLVSQGNAQAVQLNRLRVERAAELAGVELVAFPELTGNKQNDFQKTIQFVNYQRGQLHAKIAKLHDDRLAHIFSLGSELSLMVVLHEIGGAEMSQQFTPLVLERGPKTGLPEAAWKTVADAVASNLSAQELSPIKQQAANEIKDFFSRQAGPKASR